MSLSERASHLVALTTVPSRDAARTLVQRLVEARIVACGTILPGAVSIYRWRGAVEEAEEVVVLLKTTVERWEQLRDELPRFHPYEVPELVALPVARGHAPYLDWLSAETSDGPVEKA